jgi:hypothetical protein
LILPLGLGRIWNRTSINPPSLDGEIGIPTVSVPRYRWSRWRFRRSPVIRVHSSVCRLIRFLLSPDVCILFNLRDGHAYRDNQNGGPYQCQNYVEDLEVVFCGMPPRVRNDRRRGYGYGWGHPRIVSKSLSTHATELIALSGRLPTSWAELRCHCQLIGQLFRHL